MGATLFVCELAGGWLGVLGGLKLSSRAQAVAVVVAAVVVAVVIGAWALVVEPARNAATVAQSRASQSADAPMPTPARTAAPAVRVAFLGDSYTAGTGADPVAARWTTRLSESMGWVEVNHGQGGTGYASQGPTPPKTAPYPARIADVAKSNPSVVIVSGGRNDLSVAGETADDITATFKGIRAAMPSVKIVALNPWWDDDDAPDALDGLAAHIRAAVASVNGVYVESGQPLAGHGGLVISDGVHPNTAGHAALADAVARALPADLKQRPAN